MEQLLRSNRPLWSSISWCIGSGANEYLGKEGKDSLIMFAIYKFTEEESGFISLHEIAPNTPFLLKLANCFLNH